MHTKKVANATHTEEKNQSIEIWLEMIHMIKSGGKTPTRVLVTIFHMFKKVKERVSMLRNI